jgi:hypothetical protein
MLHQCLFLLAIENKHSFVCYVIAIQASQGYRSAASYDKQNSIKCLEHHLKMVALDGYEGIQPHVKFAQFFVRKAFRIFRNYHYEPRMTKE